MNEPSTGNRRGRWLLLALALLFFGPLIVAWTLYFSGEWRPGEQVNHGQLLNPAQPLPQESMMLADGSDSGDDFLRGAWTLIVLSADGCGEHCRTALYNGRQIREGLGRNRERVRRLLVVDGAPADQDFLEQEHEDLLTVDGRDEELSRALRAAAGPGEGAVLLSDPLGNLTMVFGRDVEPAGLREDLRRLLKLSHIG